MKRNVIFISLLLCLLLGIFFYQKIRLDDGKLHIVFCDVGQGDAIFVRTPRGADILVDGGPDDRVLQCLSAHMPFWDRDLELTFLTHPHADHLTGFIEIFKRYHVVSFNTEKISNNTQVFHELERLLKEKKISERFIYKGDNFRISDGVTIQTLWPRREYIDSYRDQAIDRNLDKNSFSLVQLIHYRGINILLTGDIQAEILNRILSEMNGTKIHVFKIPHHGSKTGISSESLEDIKPALAVISVGRNNRYHHPSETVLSILRDNHIPFKRTDRDGEVEVVISEKGVSLNK